MKPSNLRNPFKTLIAIATLLFIGNDAHATNWFVAPGGTGNGTSWSNAWSASTIGTVAPGDTIWIAGGTYSDNLNIANKSGTSASPITYQKVLSSDPSNVTTAVSGWNPTYGTAIATINGGPGFSGNVGNIVINGRVLNGITFPIPDGYGGWNFNGSNVTNLRFSYITMNGPGFAYNINTTVGSFGIQLFAGSGHYFGHCIFNGIVQDMTLDVDGATVEYCQFLNTSGNAAYAHPDSIYSSTATNIIIRYCYFYQSIGESVFFDGGGDTGIYFYGNVADAGPQGSGAMFETKEGYTWGDFHVYNNVFAGSWNEAVFIRGNPDSTPMELKNNLFWNCTIALESGPPNPVSDYNGYNGSVPPFDGPHSIRNSTVPFLAVLDSSISPLNFELVLGAWPIGAGVTLASPYNVDMNGNILASTMGAFAGSAATAPPAPTGLQIGSP